LPNGNGWGRQLVFIVLATLVGAMVAGTVTWITLAANVVTRKELSEYMRQASPYLLEREYIRSSIADNKSAAQRAIEEIGIMNRNLTQISVKLDLLLVEHQKTRDSLERVIHRGSN
jgi:hypothetical protein